MENCQVARSDTNTGSPLMTTWKSRLLLAAVLLATAAADSAHAQGHTGIGAPRPHTGQPAFNRPRLSPYLNLARSQFGGNDLSAVDYYLGTLPEIYRRRDTATLYSDINRLDARIDQGLSSLPPPVTRTGEPADDPLKPILDPDSAKRPTGFGVRTSPPPNQRPTGLLSLPGQPRR